MVKAKHWLGIGAVLLALAPAAWANEPNAIASFFEDLVAQIVAQVTGAPAELGGQIPAGGASLTGEPGAGQSELGIQVPVGGQSLMGEPDPGQSELGINIPAGG